MPTMDVRGKNEWMILPKTAVKGKMVKKEQLNISIKKLHLFYTNKRII